MATDDMRIRVRVDGTEQATAGLNRMRVATGGVQKAVGVLRNQILLFTFATAGMFAALGKSLQISGQFEQWEIAFETMLGSAKLAKDMMQDLFDFAKKTPFQVPELVNNARLLMGMGIEAEKLIDTMRILGDVAAGVGVPIERLALNFGQVKAQTKLTGKEMLDFSRAGIPLLSELAKNLGKSEEEITKMISSGSIGFPLVEAAFRSMSSEGGKFYNLMARQNDAFLGQWSNLKDSATRVSDAIGDRLMPIAKSVVPEIITILGDMETSIRDNTIAMNIHKTSIDFASEAYKNLGEEARKALIEQRIEDINVAINVETNITEWQRFWRSFKSGTVAMFELEEQIMGIGKAFVGTGNVISNWADAINFFTEELVTGIDKVAGIDLTEGFGSLIDEDKVSKFYQELNELKKIFEELPQKDEVPIIIPEIVFKGIDLTNFLADIETINQEAEKFGREILADIGINIDTASLAELEEALKALTDKQTVMDLVIKTNPKATEDEVKKESERILELFSKVIPVIQAKIEIEELPKIYSEGRFQISFEEIGAPSFDELRTEANKKYLAYIETAYDKEKAMLDEFLLYSIISDEEYFARLGELRTEDQIEADKIAKEIADKALQEQERLASLIESRWQQAGDIMSNTFYEAFGGNFDNIEEMFKNMLKRMMADLIASGLLMLLSGGASGGLGFFGSGGLFGGLFNSSSPTNIINVNPTPVVINMNPIGISRAAEQGDIMRGF